MADIDLIPADYRLWRTQQATVRRYLAAIAVVNMLVLIGGAALARSASNTKTHVSELQTQNAITQQQQEQLQLLGDRQAEYERRWSLLRSLRAGAAVDGIFALIDNALVAGDLWFLDWSFRRAGVTVDGEARGVETGYFIVVQEPGKPAVDHEIAVQTHMTIHGQAKDHQALSKFVRALLEQTGIRDVNVRKTSQTDYANGRVVDFDMTVVLNSAVENS